MKKTRGKVKRAKIACKGKTESGNTYYRFLKNEDKFLLALDKGIRNSLGGYTKITSDGKIIWSF